MGSFQFLRNVIQNVFLMILKNLRDDRGPRDKQLLPYAFFFLFQSSEGGCSLSLCLQLF